MENNLRKHILSNYAAVNRINISTGPTVITENIENSDVDEFVLLGPTRITKSIESSDPDGFVVGTPTGLTHSIEESDPDEFGLLGTTLETRATETSDPDEMFMEPIKNTFIVETLDEDDFLLM